MTPWLYTTLAWTLGFGAFAGAVLWAGGWRAVTRMQRVPTLRDGAALAQRDPPRGRVCVVVPAHNEARVIAGFVRSLRGETYPEFRAVLALDRCTDDTLAIARAEIGDDPRFEIVAIDDCPPDWAGKVHAVHAGLAQSKGAHDAAHLLFVDADTEFVPGCIAAALALARARKLDLLSLCSTLAYEKWFEYVVQSAAITELLTQYPLPRANGGEPPRAFANGQFMLFRRDAYDALGGHAAVKAALLEDLAFARLTAKSGRRSGMFLAAGLFRCRMYGDWAQFRRGWKRIFTEAADRKPRRLRQFALRCVSLGTVIPLWMHAAGVFGALVVARDPWTGGTLLALWALGTALWLGTLLRIAAMARAPLVTAPLHIAGAWIVARLLGQAARDIRAEQTLTWGGREYRLGAKRS